MKNISIVLAIMATVIIAGCKQQASEPSALDVIMTRTSIRSFT